MGVVSDLDMVAYEALVPACVASFAKTSIARAALYTAATHLPDHTVWFYYANIASRTLSAGQVSVQTGVCMQPRFTASHTAAEDYADMEALRGQAIIGYLLLLLRSYSLSEGGGRGTNEYVQSVLSGIALFRILLRGVSPKRSNNTGDGYCWYYTAVNLKRAIATPQPCQDFQPSKLVRFVAGAPTTVIREMSVLMAGIQDVLCDDKKRHKVLEAICDAGCGTGALLTFRNRNQLARASVGRNRQVGVAAYPEGGLASVLRFLPGFDTVNWVYCLFVSDSLLDFSGHRTPKLSLKDAASTQVEPPAFGLHTCYSKDGTETNICYETLASYTTGILVMHKDDHFEYPETPDKCLLSLSSLLNVYDASLDAVLSTLSTSPRCICRL